MYNLKVNFCSVFLLLLLISLTKAVQQNENPVTESEIEEHGQESQKDQETFDYIEDEKYNSESDEAILYASDSDTDVGTHLEEKQVDILGSPEPQVQNGQTTQGSEIEQQQQTIAPEELKWYGFLNFEGLYIEKQARQPFMVQKESPEGQYLYFPAFYAKAMKLYKFYKNNMEDELFDEQNTNIERQNSELKNSNNKNSFKKPEKEPLLQKLKKTILPDKEKKILQNLKKKIKNLYEIKSNLNETHFDLKHLQKLYNRLLNKNIYDFVFYGSNSKTPLRPTCPKKTKGKIEILLRKPKTQNVISNLDGSPDQNIPEESSKLSKPEVGKLSPAPSDKVTSPKKEALLSTKSFGKKPSNGSSSKRISENIQLENYEKIVYNGQILEAQLPIKKDHYYWPSLNLCETELEPAFIHQKMWQHYDLYDAGYLVEFSKPPKKPKDLWSNDQMITPDNIIWYHLAFFILDKDTKDTIYTFSYIPFYDIVKNKIKDLAVYTDYAKNEDIYPQDMNFDHLYSTDNQEYIFTNLFPSNYQNYFNKEKKLILVKQELIDQKTLPVVSYRRIALYYINIAPIYQRIQELTWVKVEEAVRNIPIDVLDENDGNIEVEKKVTEDENEIQEVKEKDASNDENNITKDKEKMEQQYYAPIVRVVTGTYGQLEIENRPVHLYKQDGLMERSKVPYAFFKLVHVEYRSPDSLLSKADISCTHFFTIVIVTHNDPFEENPQPICENRISCLEYGWKDIEQINPQFGFTYCCIFTDSFAEKLTIKAVKMAVHSNRILNLNTLKEVIKEKLFYHEKQVPKKDRIPK